MTYGNPFESLSGNTTVINKTTPTVSNIAKSGIYLYYLGEQNQVL